MTSSSDGLTAPFALVRFRSGGAEPVLGLVAGARVREIGPDELGAPDLNAFLAGTPASWERLGAVAEQQDASWQSLADVTLTAPVTPRQVLQTGANYRTHVIDLVAAGRAKNDPRPIEELRAWAADMMDRRAREGRRPGTGPVSYTHLTLPTKA